MPVQVLNLTNVTAVAAGYIHSLALKSDGTGPPCFPPPDHCKRLTSFKSPSARQLHAPSFLTGDYARGVRKIRAVAKSAASPLSRSSAVRIWEEKDPQSQRILAIKQYISTYEQQWRTIWMDDRPHPPALAPHTFMGFSTGKWEGNTLTVYTTHIKQGWIRRNGFPQSDKATLTEHFIRHGDLLTHVSILTDPVYLTEPLIKTQNFRAVVEEGANWLYPCDPVVEIDRPNSAPTTRFTRHLGGHKHDESMEDQSKTARSATKKGPFISGSI